MRQATSPKRLLNARLWSKDVAYTQEEHLTIARGLPRVAALTAFIYDDWSVRCSDIPAMSLDLRMRHPKSFGSRRLLASFTYLSLSSTVVWFCKYIKYASFGLHLIKLFPFFVLRSRFALYIAIGFVRMNCIAHDCIPIRRPDAFGMSTASLCSHNEMHGRYFRCGRLEHRCIQATTFLSSGTLRR